MESTETKVGYTILDLPIIEKPKILGCGGIRIWLSQTGSVIIPVSEEDYNRVKVGDLVNIKVELCPASKTINLTTTSNC